MNIVPAIEKNMREEKVFSYDFGYVLIMQNFRYIDQLLSVIFFFSLNSTIKVQT